MRTQVDEINEINEREWRNEANWHLGHTFYFARRDTRVVVPKWHETRVSRTLNFGRKESYLIVVLLLAPAILIFALAIPSVVRSR